MVNDYLRFKIIKREDHVKPDILIINKSNILLSSDTHEAVTPAF